MRKGVSPTVSTLIHSLDSYPLKVMVMGVFLPKRRIQSVNRQEASWESTVAQAAPDTPILKTKINTGSNTILTKAPMTTESIPSPEYP